MKKYLPKIKKFVKNNLNLVILVVVIALIIIIFSVWGQKQNISNVSNQPSVPNSAPNSVLDNENKNVQVKPKTVVPALTYQEALSVYKDKRFQFSFTKENNCLMSPTSSTFKKGTKVMLDNRTPKPLTVYLDGIANAIKAYGFKIVTLTTTAQLPHTMKVDCNAGKNNGQIILQK